MTLFDHIVLGIVGISVLLGIFRGLVRESFALASWVVAFVTSSAYAGSLAVLMQKQIPDDNWRALAAFVVLFLGVLILMNIVSLLAHKMIARAGLAVEDRLLGCAFGFVRGMVVVLILVIGAGLTALPRQPVWKDAMLAPHLQQLAQWVKQWLPQGWAKNISYSQRRGQAE